MSKFFATRLLQHMHGPVANHPRDKDFHPHSLADRGRQGSHPEVNVMSCNFTFRLVCERRFGRWALDEQGGQAGQAGRVSRDTHLNSIGCGS
ncbi:hypothetical protein E2C01_052659 [Portunus trituberculatus]|uniref:Uncharacterized protein n=1 Tax=Portunus trituberculatus TaxID=210409 RepID=A0A5B7GI98_PORTR|nr:hypothetical protein [Portunus trituberculatus]